MILYLWLFLCIAAVAENICKPNFYPDHLTEICEHCSKRCNSPPTLCTTYCRPSSPTKKEAGENQNARLIYIVMIVLLSFCMALMGILKVVRRKACKLILIAKAQKQDSSESERGSDTTEQSEDVDGSAAANTVIDVEEGMSPTHYNSSLPLPSTEEGTTVLVTTKTVQTYNCSAQYTQGVTLGVWTTAAV